MVPFQAPQTRVRETVQRVAATEADEVLTNGGRVLRAHLWRSALY